MRNAFLLAAIGATLISGCSTTNQQTNAKVEQTKHMTKEQLIGKWDCVTTYSDDDLRSFDEMHIKPDGTFTDSSSLYFPIVDNLQNALFSYSRYITGNWALDGNKITYLSLTEGKLLHKENKSSPLWENVKEKKLEEYVRSTDKIYQQGLSASKTL